jgi:hypothetical protein
MKFTLILTALLFCVTALFAQTDSLVVSWDPNSEPDMLEYQLYRSVNSVINFSLIETIPHPTTLTVDRPTPPMQGNMYLFTLRAVDDALNMSGFSDTVAVGIPLITDATVPSDLTAQVTIPLDNIFSDPDNIQGELTKTFLSITNCTVSIVGNDLVIVPPANFLGAGSFYVRLEDIAGFWDGKTIAFNIDTRDLTPPLPPTGLDITR